MRHSPEVEIVRLLKAGGRFVSGQSLSDSLGVSRTAVWKHMEALRKMGYRIEASPSKGYRLSGESPFNGVEVEALLPEGAIAGPVHFFREIGSTNVKAFELGRSGAPEGAIVMADSQASGKGRIGRVWVSPPGVNLYASIILRPSIAPQAAPGLTFLMAVAAAEAIGEFSPLRPTVKWPNDILIDGKKTAGILLEMDSEPDRVHFVVAGVGVNINMTPGMFPEPLRQTATSIREQTGVEVDRARFSASLFSSVGKWYKVYLERGFPAILEAWKGYFASTGNPVRVTSFDRVISGVCAGVDVDGALLVRLPSGEVERVVSGDIESVRGC